MLPDLYEALDHKLIDTASPLMADYNWIYLPFNGAEAAIWMFCALRVLVRHGHGPARRSAWRQASAFALFGASDVIELSGTTPLLLLFKLALIIALLSGRASLAVAKPSLVEGR